MGSTPDDSCGLAMRSRIIMAAAEGRSNSAIAGDLGIARVTVGIWRNRFAEQRLEGGSPTSHDLAARER